MKTWESKQCEFVIYPGYPSGSLFRDLGPYKGPFEEIGSLKGFYFAEKVPKISKIAPRAINAWS